jgi:hypothetical protein
MTVGSRREVPDRRSVTLRRRRRWTQDAEGWDPGLRTIACIAYDRGGADLQGSRRAAGP